MAAKKPTHEEHRIRELSRRLVLAYIGAFGVVGDEVGKLFDRFVTRGETMEKRARKLLKQNDKAARKFVADFEHAQKDTVAKATKSARKTVKRIEHAVA